MVFVDYDTIEHATKALRAHQGWKWEPVDEGLKIDYDQAGRLLCISARCSQKQCFMRFVSPYHQTPLAFQFEIGRLTTSEHVRFKRLNVDPSGPTGMSERYSSNTNWYVAPRERLPACIYQTSSRRNRRCVGMEEDTAGCAPEAELRFGPGALREVLGHRRAEATPGVACYDGVRWGEAARRLV